MFRFFPKGEPAPKGDEPERGETTRESGEKAWTGLRPMESLPPRNGSLCEPCHDMVMVVACPKAPRG